MSVLWIEFDLTNEPILLPVVPHSEGCEFPQQIGQYRGIVEEAVCDHLGRPTFFDAAVEMLMGRIAARIEGEAPTAYGSGEPQIYAHPHHS